MSTQSPSLTNSEFPITGWIKDHYGRKRLQHLCGVKSGDWDPASVVLVKNLANRLDLELSGHLHRFSQIEKRLEKAENGLVNETENRVREVRWLTAQLIEARSETVAISQRVASEADRINRLEQKPQDESTQDQKAILEELEQQKRENARLHQQYREQITGLEQKLAERERKHAEEIQELKMLVMQLAASQGGHKHKPSSLESAKDLEFQSPVSSDSEDFFG